MKSPNNYKVSGRKMTPRFGMSKREEREAVKSDFMPGEPEVKAYGRPSEFSAKYWSKLRRMSNRQIRTHEKSLPLVAMDGGYYHG